MLMTLGFHGLTTSCIIGMREWERKREQILECDLEVSLECPTHDDISSTVDYSELSRLFARHAREGAYYLLESLAQNFRELLIRSYPAICSGMLEIRKPAAIAEAQHAFVRLRW